MSAETSSPLILLIDDDRGLVTVMQQMAKKWGYAIETASNGEEGILKAQGKRPNLVILDVMMPGMNGWTFVQKFKSTPGNSSIPVIFLTALRSPKERVKGFQLGADDYLQKPFYFDELKMRVDNLIKRQAKPEETEKVLKGSLKQFGLPSLLMGLEMEQKSGILLLEPLEKQERACLFLKEGRIVRARIVGKAAPKNEEVIYYLLRWPDGHFEFKAMPIEIGEEIFSSITSLLLEAARRIDEIHRDIPSNEKAISKKILRLDPIFQDIMPEILDNMQKDISSMEESLKKGEYERVERIGHSIKGTGGSYGFDETFEIGMEIEKNAKARNEDEVRKSIARLVHYLENIELVYEESSPRDPS